MSEQENTSTENIPSSVTKEIIEANIVSEHYFTAAEGVMGACVTSTSVCDCGMTSCNSLDLLTFCVLVLRNGFKVTGESACVNHAIFDAEKGRKYAREKAVEKCWGLMGYELATQRSAHLQQPQEENHCEY